jgi:hypothetical protein
MVTIVLFTIRTDSTKETVTISSGNCDNVKIGDGQIKTFVDGTVTSIKAGADGRSIDIGYRANDGSGAVGVPNANWGQLPIILTSHTTGERTPRDIARSRRQARQ